MLRHNGSMLTIAVSCAVLAGTAVVFAGPSNAKHGKHATLLKGMSRAPAKIEDLCDTLTAKAVASVEAIRPFKKAAAELRVAAPTSVLRLFERVVDPALEPETAAEKNLRDGHRRAELANATLKLSGCGAINIDEQLRTGPRLDWSKTTAVHRQP